MTLARLYLFSDRLSSSFHYQKALSQISSASWGEADFTFSYLSNQIEFAEENGRFRSHLVEDQAYFRFGGTGKLYNIYDGGNFMWGAWTKILTLTNTEIWLGSNLNEVLQGRMGDSKADQSAMWSGRNF